MTTDNTFWQTKLHARLHDPAEKALVLLRDPQGHENGTSRALHRDLGFHQLEVKDWLPPDHASVLGSVLSSDGEMFKKGIPVTMYRHVKRADWWAAAADRPQWPLEKITVNGRDGSIGTFGVAPWARVRWSQEPKLIHPLTGKTLDLKTLRDTEISDIKQRSLDHFQNLIIRNNDSNEVDWRRTLLAFWRFGPELKEQEDDGKLGFLWPLLPADTRVPDHSIWDHLDLTSAFAGAFSRDKTEQAALLSLAIGPVQGFIAAARTTSDLWAGSHLLSRLSWEAMKVVCEKLGPDAILFPRLRSLPQVDVWLRDEAGLPHQWFQDLDWTKRNTDANPLFTAALPNRFVAVVPACEVESIAEQVTGSVRDWLQQRGKEVVHRLLEKAGLPADESLYCFEQMQQQLHQYPEVHWAATPFSLIGVGNRDRDTDLDTSALAQAMQPFFVSNEQGEQQPGFLAKPAWQVLGKDADLAGNIKFFSPNPGVLYPAVHDLSERVLAAAKAVRPFAQSTQEGWRCSLTGETEWLTTDKAQLLKSWRQQPDTLWAKLAANHPAWARKGEHLGALAAVKRLWPTLFAEEVKRIVDADTNQQNDQQQDEPTDGTGSEVKQGKADRFVVSTHTMALAGNLEKLDAALSANDKQRDKIEKLLRPEDRAPALPRKLAHLKSSLAAKVPAALDRLREDESGDSELHQLENAIKDLFGHKPDAYYALILFDGDRMGQILSGEKEDCTITYLDSFHPKVRNGFTEQAEKSSAIKEYGKSKRAVSPNRHLAISAALNDFALHVVPQVVESEHRGRVIYAGGDDVLAMLPVAELLSVMPRLRQTYSGVATGDEKLDWGAATGNRHRLLCKDGFALMPERNGSRQLLRLMGEGATASCGAVVAHHQTPLSSVLRELRQAEQRAKHEGGRNAFSLTILKRSGGALRFTDQWNREKGNEKSDVIKLLIDLRDFLADQDRVSRRAAYNSLVWLKDLPDDADSEMLGCLLAQQLDAQTRKRKTTADYHDVPGLARRLAEFATNSKQTSAVEWLENILSIAEFLAREVRSPGTDKQDRTSPDTPIAGSDNRYPVEGSS